ncbi:MAG: tRNA lysidine(34) synthetase TilS [Chthoniobacteraceae bacterium]|nr:tRNA lysidine(34) synthetase TilS [Chthoniobacteraceae bacterium]
MKPSAFSLDLTGVSRTARYLVGVSGGRDSVALLHALVEAGFRRLIVCHLNHGLRGRAAAADARFVAALAAKLGLELESEKADVTRLAAHTGQSLETAAREARYAFFARVARKRRCRALFLAHHADDQVETFLFNLFRGAGRAGLGGMRRESGRTVEGVRLRVLRPLLGVWRKEIDAYVRAHALRFREDASNRAAEFTRNRIRHTLFPVLEEVFGRDIRQALWRTSAILQAEEEWLALLSGAAKEGTELAAPLLQSQPVAQQRRRILAWLRENAVPDTGYGQVEAVRSLLAAGAHGPAKVNLPGGWHARRRAKRLFLERP